VAIENAWYRAPARAQERGRRCARARNAFPARWPRPSATSSGSAIRNARLALYMSPAFETHLLPARSRRCYADWARLAGVRARGTDREKLRTRMDDLSLSGLELEFPRVPARPRDALTCTCACYVVRDGVGRHVRRAGVIQDITERKAQGPRASSTWPIHDSLTGLPNRTDAEGPSRPRRWSQAQRAGPAASCSRSLRSARADEPEKKARTTNWRHNGSS